MWFNSDVTLCQVDCVTYSNKNPHDNWREEYRGLTVGTQEVKELIKVDDVESGASVAGN